MSRILFAILLVLPVICAKIEIDVRASKNAAENMIRFHGRNQDVITDEEQITFNLMDENLRTAIEAYFGAKPTEAFLKSPTPWGDLYRTFKWKQVERVLTAQKAQILYTDSAPFVISSQFFENNDPTVDQAIEPFNVKVKHSITNNVSSIWDKDSQLDVNSDMTYNFDIEGKDAKKWQHLLSYTAKWGENVMKSLPAEIETEFKIVLKPSQVAYAELHVVRNTMNLQIDYEATLRGSTAVRYADGYRGHTFWGLDIKSVMDAAGMKPVRSSEMVELSYYSDAKIVVRDALTDNVIYTRHRVPVKYQ